MDSPHLLYGMARPHDPYLAQSYNAIRQPEKPLIDLRSMDSNIDPLLDCASSATSAFVPGALGHPHQQQQVQRFMDDRERTAFFNPPPVQSPQLQIQHHFQQHQSVLPTTVHVHFQQQRWGSPASSHDHGSSCSSALSPAGDSEAFHELGPATPPAGADPTVAPPHHIKYQPAGSHTPPQSFWGSPRLLVANDYTAATCMPPAGYVNPSEINPTSGADFDLCALSIPVNCDLEPPQRSLTLQSTSSAGFPDFAADRTSTSAETFSVPIKQEATITAAAYHPTSPLNQESAESETEHPRGLKRSHSADQDDDEGNWDGDDSSDFAPTRPARPANNRSRTAAPSKKKPAPRRPSKPATQSKEEPQFPKRQRRQSSQMEADLTSPVTSAAMAPSPSGTGIMLTQAGHGHLTCRDCPQATSFKTEGALETHVKKQHKRPFVCVFVFAGCVSTFASKNEWKRHVVSQHILLNFWVCTQDDCAKTVNAPPVLATTSSSGDDPAMVAATPAVPARAVSSSLRGRNSCAIAPASSLTVSSGTAGHHQLTFGPRLPNGAIFNRKDLYTQHVRRMHAPDRIRQQRLGGSSSSPTSVAPMLHRRKSSSSSTITVAAAMSAAAAMSDSETMAWENRLKQMQRNAEMERCRLPTRMLCPAPGCTAIFEGGNAWDERMEHLAKHLDAAARGDEPAVRLDGGAGAEPDRSLIEWASRPDVAIIVPCATGSGTGMQWVLNNPLKPSGVAVMAITAAAAAATKVTDNTPLLDEIVVERGDEDAEGEEDEY